MDEGYIGEERQAKVLNARIVLQTARVGVERVGVLNVQTGKTLVEEAHLQHHANHALCRKHTHRFRTRRHLGRRRRHVVVQQVETRAVVVVADLVDFRLKRLDAPQRRRNQFILEEETRVRVVEIETVQSRRKDGNQMLTLG